VLTELIGGGAERSMLSIIDALDRQRFESTLILFTDRCDHSPPSGVPIVILSAQGATSRRCASVRASSSSRGW
jgi:hypothetical protein